MNSLGVLALIAIGVLAFSRRASASVAPRTTPTPMSTTEDNIMTQYGRNIPMPLADVAAGIADADAQWAGDLARGERIYAAHTAEFDAHPTPVPPRLMAVVMGRESGGRDVREVTALGETGWMQLTPAEVQQAGGGDPHSLTDSLRIAQILHKQAITVCPQTDEESAVGVAILSRSIGLGVTRWLYGTIPAGEGRWSARVVSWIKGTPTKPERINQTPRKFSMRIYRAMLRANKARLAGWLPSERAV